MRHVLLLSTIAFVLHFGWESVQCSLLYVHGTYDASWGGMVRAAFGDVLLTWMIYASVGVAAGRWRWDAGAWRARDWTVLAGAAIALAVAVEVRALSNGRWTYMSGMPTIPGLRVGLAPIAQLLILTPLSIRISSRFAPRQGDTSRDR